MIIELDSLYISGALFLLCVVFFYLWLRAEGKLRREVKTRRGIK